MNQTATPSTETSELQKKATGFRLSVKFKGAFTHSMPEEMVPPGQQRETFEQQIREGEKRAWDLLMDHLPNLPELVFLIPDFAQLYPVDKTN